jgi:hypothetical protein
MPWLWLKQYVPISVLCAIDVLADHVDFWEEEAFRVNGKWRERTLTNFIRAGYTSDRGQWQLFRRLLIDYIDLSSHQPAKDDRVKQLDTAVAEVKHWLRFPYPDSSTVTYSMNSAATDVARPPVISPSLPSNCPMPSSNRKGTLSTRPRRNTTTPPALCV